MVNAKLANRIKNKKAFVSVSIFSLTILFTFLILNSNIIYFK